MENRPTPNIFRLLKKCHDLESRAAGIYRFLAYLHRNNSRLSALFEKTAREEDHHAAQFDMVKRLYLKNTACNIDMDQSRIDEVLATARSALEEMMEIPPSAVEALENVVGLEQAFAEFHVHNAVHFKDQSIRKLFRAMMAADQEHVETLKRALAAYSS